ncbi:hypothetical protein F442_22522, partial [Phytophthora nicotianae P10297]
KLQQKSSTSTITPRQLDGSSEGPPRCNFSSKRESRGSIPPTWSGKIFSNFPSATGQP